MKFLDARRLTGPSLMFDSPGTILDVSCTPEEARALLPVWSNNVARMLEALDWPAARMASREMTGGVSLAFSAPIDALYAASEINEWAWAASAFELGVCEEEPDFDETLETIRTSAAEEANIELMWLIDEATERGKTLLWDDDFVSVGLGRGSDTWPVREIPDAFDWERFHDVLIGVVTGTNGKTTTVRLAMHILRAAGRNVGFGLSEAVSQTRDREQLERFEETVVILLRNEDYSTLPVLDSHRVVRPKRTPDEAEKLFSRLGCGNHIHLSFLRSMFVTIFML